MESRLRSGRQLTLKGKQFRSPATAVATATATAVAVAVAAARPAVREKGI